MNLQNLASMFSNSSTPLTAADLQKYQSAGLNMANFPSLPSVSTYPHPCICVACGSPALFQSIRGRWMRAVFLHAASPLFELQVALQFGCCPGLHFLVWVFEAVQPDAALGLCPLFLAGAAQGVSGTPLNLRLRMETVQADAVLSV